MKSHFNTNIVTIFFSKQFLKLSWFAIETHEQKHASSCISSKYTSLTLSTYLTILSYIFYFAAPIPIVPPPNWPLEDWPPTLQPKTKGIDKEVQVKPSYCDRATDTTLELFEIPKPLPKPKTRKFGTQTNSGGTENTAITDKLLKSNRKCLVYCGIPLSFLKMILEVLEGKAYKYEKLSLADQVVLFYHKCKTNLTNGCLAIEFNVTEDKVSAVFEHIEFALFDHAKDSIYWLTREQNQKLMPEAFKKEYPNCIGILDACKLTN
jgi:hypothetical protein